MQSALGQSVVIENRPGAGGATGTKSVATSDPDGYTLLIGTSATLGVVPALVKNPGYDPVTSFAPVAKIADSTTVLIVHPNFPANSIKELVAYAKANPGKLSYASAGAGNQTHLAAELLNARTGIGAVHVLLQERRRDGDRGAGRAGADVVSGHLDPAAADRREKAEGACGDERRRGIRSCPMCRPWPRAACPDYVTTFWTGVIVGRQRRPSIDRQAQRRDQRRAEHTRNARQPGARRRGCRRRARRADFGAFIVSETNEVERDRADRRDPDAMKPQRQRSFGPGFETPRSRRRAARACGTSPAASRCRSRGA